MKAATRAWGELSLYRMDFSSLFLGSSRRRMYRTEVYGRPQVCGRLLFDGVCRDVGQRRCGGWTTARGRGVSGSGEPVSYTHLDVYKRQLLLGAAAACRSADGRAALGRRRLRCGRGSGWPFSVDLIGCVFVTAISAPISPGSLPCRPDKRGRRRSPAWRSD